jgi:endonuclease III
MNNTEVIKSYFNEIIPDPVCELNYNKDYELLIAIMLSAQTTDKRVNIVTNKLFNKYKSVKKLSLSSYDDIEPLIKELGSYTKKTNGVISISKKIVDECNCVVPNDREVLESFPMVGRKTASVFLSEWYDVPTIAVDTHVDRVSKRLGLALDNDDVLKIETKLKKLFDEKEWNRINHQLVLFGRYFCIAKNPKCDECKLKDICKYYNKENS